MLITDNRRRRAGEIALNTPNRRNTPALRGERAPEPEGSGAVEERYRAGALRPGLSPRRALIAGSARNSFRDCGTPSRDFARPRSTRAVESGDSQLIRDLLPGLARGRAGDDLLLPRRVSASSPRVVARSSRAKM